MIRPSPSSCQKSCIRRSYLRVQPHARRSKPSLLFFPPSFTPSILRFKPLTARILWRCSSNTLTACPVQNHTRILLHRLRALTIRSHWRIAASRASDPCRWRYIPRGQRGALAHHLLPRYLPPQTAQDRVECDSKCGRDIVWLVE